MKSEMLNLHDQLRSTDLIGNHHDAPPGGDGLRRSTSLGSKVDTAHVEKEVAVHEKPELDITSNLVFSSEPPCHIKTVNPSPVGFERHKVQSPICEIIELEWDIVGGSVSDSKKTGRGRAKESRVITAVQLINVGVSHVQSIGNQTVNKLASFLNVSREVSDSNEQSPIDDVIYDEIESGYLQYLFGPFIFTAI